MRKSKQISVNGQQVTIHELRVEDIFSLWGYSGGISLSDFQSFIQNFLPKFTDLRMADLAKLAPSELVEFWDVMKEINSDFLSACKLLGLGEMVSDLKNSILRDLNATYVNSLNEAMSKFGITESVSSSEPKRSPDEMKNDG